MLIVNSPLTINVSVYTTVNKLHLFFHYLFYFKNCLVFLLHLYVIPEYDVSCIFTVRLLGTVHWTLKIYALNHHSTCYILIIQIIT